MYARDHVDPVEDAAVDDRTGAAGRQLLGVLEDEDDLAGELVAAVDEELRCAEEHRRVAVVAAGVHHSRPRRRVRDVVLLEDRERVDVGPQRDDLPGRGAAKASDDRRPGRPLDLEAAERAQRLLDERRRLVLLEGELRIGVEVPAPRDRACLEVVGDEL